MPHRRLARRALLAAWIAALPACARGEQAGLAEPFALPRWREGAPLRPLGGLEISPASLGFGSLSALHLANDLTLTVISDRAQFAELSLSLDAGLRPSGLTLRRAGLLRDGTGRPLRGIHAADSEALARLPDGSWLVAFERWHRIRRYRDLDGPGSFVAPPPGLERAPSNSGLETLAVLADGNWLAIAEGLDLPGRRGLTAAWHGRPGAWMPMAWRRGAGLHPVDAAPLPDGGALVLERGFSLLGGFSGRLLRLPAAALRNAEAGAVLEGEEILRLAWPLPADNYEGVAVANHQGRRLVALVSDDNGNRLQRTLLLLFELLD